MGNRKATITRILGQSFMVGPFTVTLVALSNRKARLVVELPDDLDIEDNDDYKEIIKNTLVMQDDHGWRRAIPRTNIELPPDYYGGNSKDKNHD